MILFGVVESKVEDPRGRLPRLKCTFRDARDVSQPAQDIGLLQKGSKRLATNQIWRRKGI